MSTMSTTRPNGQKWFRLDRDTRHAMRLRFAWLMALGFVALTVFNGMPYYLLALEKRANSPLNSFWRPSGTVGIRLGMLGLLLFGLLWLYPIRKRWPWLGRLGKTKHWLDFHVLLGVSAPVLITLHSSFKLRGLAGLAYWIMVAVALSGIVGRYIYSRIPRSMSTAELSLQEIEAQIAQAADQLHLQELFTPADIAPLLRLPARAHIDSLSLLRALFEFVRFDLALPFHVSALRRRHLPPWLVVLTVGGFLPSRNASLEAVIMAARAQSGLTSKLLFLSRLQEVFHLWHVVHRPFSYSFVVLVATHITVVMLFGYY